MEIQPLRSQHVDASDIPVERLAGNSRLTEDEKVAEASRQFEAILLRQILQNTQKTVIQSKFADNSTSAGIYQDMVSQQLADSISKSGALHLAESLQQQVSRQIHRVSPAGHPSTRDASPTTPGTEGARPSTSPHTHAGRTRGGVRPAHAPSNLTSHE
ncbi:MAG: rod-binding protein [Verrucomicrobiota bacterium]